MDGKYYNVFVELYIYFKDSNTTKLIWQNKLKYAKNVKMNI
jgi:hypothetical protein